MLILEIIAILIFGACALCWIATMPENHPINRRIWIDDMADKSKWFCLLIAVAFYTISHICIMLLCKTEPMQKLFEDSRDGYIAVPIPNDFDFKPDVPQQD